MIPFLICVWAFLKEIFFGERIKDPYKDKPAQDKTKTKIAKAVGKFIDKMQSSRKLMAFVAMLLVISLFVNYKTIKQLVLRKDDEQHSAPAQAVEPESKKRPTIPSKKPEDMRRETLEFLETVYGAKK